MSSSSEDDWGYDDSEEENENAQTSPQLQVSSTDYQILGPKDIEYYQQRAISQIVDQFGFNYKQAASLLRKFSWDTERLSQVVIDGNISDLISLDGSVQLGGYGSTLCLVCFTEYQSFEMRGLECGHFFCRSCYKDYLTEEVSKGFGCIFCKCPMDNCELLIPEELFKEILDQHSFMRYKEYLKNSYVELNPYIKWCPAPDCQYCVRYPPLCKRDVVCKCGYFWCFQCGNEAHRPLRCEDVAKWNEHQLGAEDLDNEWININTKKCPRCGSSIQKNQGCMHMTCQCKHEFCWLCMGPWSEHGQNTGGYYKCNKFSEKRDRGEYKSQEEEKSRSIVKLKRYQQYVERFIEHKKSIRFAQEKNRWLYDLAHDIRKTTEGKYLNVNCLELAGKIVVEARLAIAYSYPLGYFLKDLKKLNFYEFIQSELERNLEILDEKTDFHFEIIRGNRLVGNFKEILDEIEQLVNVLRHHFDETITAMENGLPLVKNSGEIEDIGDVSEVLDEDHIIMTRLRNSNEWSCPMCTFINNNSNTNCEICDSARPNF